MGDLEPMGETLAQPALAAQAFLAGGVAELRRRGIVGKQRYDALLFCRQLFGAEIGLVEPQQERPNTRFLGLLLRFHRQLDLGFAQPFLIKLAQVDDAVDSIEPLTVMDDHLALAVASEDIDPELNRWFQRRRNREFRLREGTRRRDAQRSQHGNQGYRSVPCLHIVHPHHRIRTRIELSTWRPPSQGSISRLAPPAGGCRSGR